MTKKGAPKTPAMLDWQKKHNKQRKKARAAAAKKTFETPKEGAREKLVGALVGGVVKRLLKRCRKNDARRGKSDAKNRERAAKWNAALMKEARERGESQREAYQRRKREKEFKQPNVFYNERARHKERIKEDVAYKTSVNLRTRLAEFMRYSGSRKTSGTMQLVGCSKKQLVQHLQSQIPENADLKEYSTDHIFPMTRYDASDPEQQKMMMHFSNLQPMKLYGKGGNVSKGNKLPTLIEAMKVERWAWPSNVSEKDLVDDRQ
jgi:hypothetical protein